MSVCPLEFRYGNEDMKAIFSEANKLRYLLEVEAALALAHADLGTIPKEAAEEIAAKVREGAVKVERVQEIEDKIKHDIMAVVKALTEQCSEEAGKYIHLGATSNDIIDTASALQIVEAFKIIEKRTSEITETLVVLADRHKKTVQVGRTHGQWAVPTTFGLKMAVYALEMKRHIERLAEMEKRIAVGKMMGAVGTGASFGPKAMELQKRVMEHLGLDPPIATTQILQRDRYAELIFVLANIASSIEKFATEIRNLQRGEIGEVSEAFDVKKQVGSSTMAHKRNPISSENVCGLARVVRGFVLPAFENIPSWHERDLTNSSAERFTIPHAFILTDYILVRMNKVLEDLIVNKDRMRENLERTRGMIMAEPVMLALVEKGMGRQEAHEVIRQCSMKAEEKGLHLGDALLEDERVTKYLSRDELDAALDPFNYIGASAEIVEAAIKKCRE
jgi:adenylosuccinate lyase